MGLIICFIIFIGAVIACILTGCTLVVALAVGLIVFFTYAMMKGNSFGSVSFMSWKGLSKGLIVVRILIIIGLLTGVWRASGTIAFFVYYGIKIISPSIFIIVAFLLTCFLSYAIGTSFGVAATVGVIFMALARAGGVNELITAGTLMSGIYFGDRGSPASSSAILVAAVTGTEHMDNVKRMAKYAAVPFAAVLAIYTGMSLSNPISKVDPSFIKALCAQFHISLWCAVPAVLMLILPICKVRVSYSMLASIVSGMMISIAVEKITLTELLLTMLKGYNSNTQMGEIFNGGGLISMVEVILIVALSSMYSGIFEDTDMLAVFQDKINRLIDKIGKFPTMVIVSLILIALFCNQTLTTMMASDMFKKPYEKRKASHEELASDIQNSLIVLSAVVPWSIACSVPLSFMGVGIGALPFSFYLYLLPLIYGFEKLTKKGFCDRT